MTTMPQPFAHYDEHEAEPGDRPLWHLTGTSNRPPERQVKPVRFPGTTDPEVLADESEPSTPPEWGCWSL